jgi:hypothetical protein
MLVVRGRLSPEAGAVLVRALEAAREALYARRRAAAVADEPEAEPPTHGQQQADALALVAETALAGELDHAPGQERYQVVVHVDAAVLADPGRPGQAALEDGVSVPAETSRRLACEATRVVMRHAGDGSVLDVGRRTRAIPPGLRRALAARDRGCRFPGCGVRHAQGHHLGFARPGRRGPSPATPGGAHIQHWANGGPTRLDNLALLCRRHHRAVHEEGYRVVRAADGALLQHASGAADSRGAGAAGRARRPGGGARRDPPDAGPEGRYVDGWHRVAWRAARPRLGARRPAPGGQSGRVPAHRPLALTFPLIR